MPVLVGGLPLTIALAVGATAILGRSYVVFDDGEVWARSGARQIRVNGVSDRLLVPRHPGPLGRPLVVEHDGVPITILLVGQGAVRTPRRLHRLVRECRGRSIDCEWVEGP